MKKILQKIYNIIYYNLHLRLSQFVFLFVVDCKTKPGLFRAPFQAPRPILIFQQMLGENFAKMTSRVRLKNTNVNT